MKLLFTFIIISLIYQGNLLGANYYVSSTGSDSNPGTLALPWATVTHASASTNPGDTIYVKAGLYNEHVTISKSGTDGHPVVFIGYKSTPGDDPPVLVNNADPYAAFSPADMPTFDGGDRASGFGFNCQQRSYLVIKNFQIENYKYGMLLGWSTQDAGNNYLYNVNIRNIGDINASYSGYALLLGLLGEYYSNYNIIDSCLILNSAAEGIGINGDHNKVNGCKVYCNQTPGGAPTDYYMIITGSYNEITSCYLERTPGLSHTGHGFTCKDNAEQAVDGGGSGPAIAVEHNVFKYCVARNFEGEGFSVRHRMVRFNLFYHCKAIGTHTGSGSGGEGIGIVIRDGASDNVFDGCIMDSCHLGIRFDDTIEDGDMGSDPTGHPGNNNVIINSLILNSYVGVAYDDYSIPSDAGDNTIANCTFYNTRYMFSAGRSCKNMKYINNIYVGTLPSTPGGAFKIGSFANDIVPNGATTNFSNCNFYNIEGGMPAGFVTSASNSISADPLFKNAATHDLHLQSGSPSINTGKALSFVKTDYDSIARPQGAAFDMGAYEFRAEGSDSTGSDSAVFYVSTTGSDSNPGTLALPWATVTYASANTNPGDTIYVKAGLYNEHVTISKNGTDGHPVVFIGYKSTPGDNPPVLVNNADPYAAFSPADMPTFDGGDRASGVGFNCQKRSYFVIKNFQIENYKYGILLGWSTTDAGNNYLYNINIRNIGDINASYSGYGLLLGLTGSYTSNYNIIDSCLVLNAAAEALTIVGDHNSISGCKVYCNQDNGSAATDYYLTINGSYNEITGCYVERTPGLSHTGHGFTCKDYAGVGGGSDPGSISTLVVEHNVFKYCVARNFQGESFAVRHRMVRYNLFYHCKAIGTHTGSGPGGEGIGIVIRDGAHDNVFDGCIMDSCDAAIVFHDTVEDGDWNTNPTGHPGDNNVVINCLITNSYIGVDFDEYSIPSDAGNNTIANCTFYKTRYMFSAERSCKNMKYVNDIFGGTLPATPGGAFKIGTYAGDIVPNGATTNFSNCNFYNIEGGMPAGFVTSASNSISADPLFKNAATNDFHLQSGSPSINTGKALSFVKTDFDSIPRPQGAAFDMGAYESRVAGSDSTGSDSTGQSATNIKISVFSATCKGSPNGAIKILAEEKLNDTATVIGNGVNKSFPFKDSLAINNLTAGTYHVCISAEGQPDFKQCYDVVITEPKDLSVYVAVHPSDHSVTLNLDGGGIYIIQLNARRYTTSEKTITLPLAQENNLLMVSTDKTCQGIVKKLINISGKPMVFPNPVGKTLNLDLGKNGAKTTVVAIRNISSGNVMYARELTNKSGIVQLDISGLADGAYVLSLNEDNFKFTFKIIKIEK